MRIPCKRPGRLPVSAAFTLVAGLASMAGAAWAAPVDITDAWFRALPAPLPAGGYFTAANNTAQPVNITGAQSEGLRHAHAAPVPQQGRHERHGHDGAGGPSPPAAWCASPPAAIT